MRLIELKLKVFKPISSDVFIKYCALHLFTFQKQRVYPFSLICTPYYMPVPNHLIMMSKIGYTYTTLYSDSL